MIYGKGVDILRPCLHVYIFILLSLKPRTFLCMIIFREKDKFWKRSPKWKDLKTHLTWKCIHVDGDLITDLWISTCQLIVDWNKTILAAFITSLVRYPGKTKLNGKATMYCFPEYSKFFRHPVVQILKMLHWDLLDLRCSHTQSCNRENDYTGAVKKLGKYGLEKV